jgi:hypothetical protein
VWKRRSRRFRDSRFLHTRLGIRAKSLIALDFFDRTDVGANRSARGRFRLFLRLSAGILTGFSAVSPEN